MNYDCNSNNSVFLDLRGRAMLTDLADSYGFLSVLSRPFAGACRLAGCALDQYRVIYKKIFPALFTAGGCDLV